MEDTKQRLERLFLTEDWCQEDQEWLHKYLLYNGNKELNAIAVEKYKADLLKVTDGLTKRYSNAMLNSIHHNIGVNKPVKVFRWDWLLTIAASVIFVSAIGYFLKASVQMGGRNMHITSIVTKKGEVRLVKLNDGSRVWLNSDSKIEFPDIFSGKLREVSLWGEAYFDVKHLDHKPFIIHTEGLVTSVLGTSFNIKAYRDEKDIEVAVLTGKVSVSAENFASLLKPNQQIMYNKVTKRLKKPVNLVAAERILWTEGKLHFRNTPLNQVVAELKRKYDVSITIDSSLAGCTVYADFNNEPVDKIIRLLAESTNASILKNENGYRLQAFND